MAARRGVILFVVFLALLGMVVLIAALAVRRPSAAPARATALLFDVPTELEEGQPPVSGYPFNLSRLRRPTVWEVVRGLHHAAEDPRIEALVLHLGAVDWGWAKVAEVRRAVAEFRAAGKPVYASLSGGGEREYLLASSAGTISTPPLATLMVNGLAVQATFLRGTFDKLDITPNFSSVGIYKSGIEGYTRKEFSAPAREALESLLDDEFAIVRDSLARARSLSPDSVVRLFDLGPFGGEDAHAVGLVDTVLDEAGLDSLATRDGTRRRSTMLFTRYLDHLDHDDRGPRIALVTAVGTIASGKSREAPGQGTTLGSETLIKALHDAERRTAIRAVVLRIDSPGGSAQASDDIWREIRRCAAKKPVIASCSDLAASGGYYIAVAADSIVADPSTITGSIGVFGGKFNILGLYHKLGLNVETVARGRHADMYSAFRDFTPDEAARFQAQMDIVYRLFVDHVSRGRRMGKAEVDSVGQGRVWSGVAARRLGLVDHLGGIDAAIAMARAKAKIGPDEPVAIEMLPRVERPFFQRLLAELVSDEDDEETQAMLPPVLRSWLGAVNVPTGVPLTLMPYSVEIR